MPATGTWSAPGKGSAQADNVLTALQNQVPLFSDVDNCHGTAEELAAKLEKYARLLRRKVKGTDGKEHPMGRTRWTASIVRRVDVSGAQGCVTAFPPRTVAGWILRHPDSEGEQLRLILQ